MLVLQYMHMCHLIDIGLVYLQIEVLSMIVVHMR